MFWLQFWEPCHVVHLYIYSPCTEVMTQFVGRCPKRRDVTADATQRFPAAASFFPALNQEEALL